MLLKARKIMQLWEPDYPCDEAKQLERGIWRIEQALGDSDV